MAYDIVVSEIEAGTGIRPNLGKTECWGATSGDAPPGIPDLDTPAPAPPVWKGNLPVDQCGILILGSPIGTEAFVKRELDKKLHEEVEFLDRIALIPNIQVSCLLMYYCGSPRATYLLRTTPPILCQDYAKKRDAMIRKKLAKILNLTEPSLDSKAGQTHLPGRLGGLGLNSSKRSSWHW